MIPDRNQTEPYLFKVMNLHPGAGKDVDEALWKALPCMSVYRKIELESLEELLDLFVRRIIRIADLTLLSLLRSSEEENPDCEELIDSFLDLSLQEFEELQSLYLQPLFLRLTQAYSEWTRRKPITTGKVLHAEG
jgi:hypothetical protein